MSTVNLFNFHNNILIYATVNFFGFHNNVEKVS
jgi:hypothetical protein